MQKKRAQWRAATARYKAKMPPEYVVWTSMKCRCNLASHPYYALYGGKGIRVCERWLVRGQGFRNFLADMGPRPGELFHLDRVDSDKDYCPENCRWISRNENCRRARTKKWQEEQIPF